MQECNFCGSQWENDEIAKCVGCGKWNASRTMDPRKILTFLSDIEAEETERYITERAWDDVFGGGVALRSVNMIGGAPGAGKSTLMLQLLDAIAESYENGDYSCYIAAEESGGEIKARAVRIGVEHMDTIAVIEAIGGDVRISDKLEVIKPKIVVLDSLKGLCGADENLTLETLVFLKQYVVERDIACLVLNHVTKQMEMAGNMEWQHTVDGTFFFSGQSSEPRILSSIKNRNGPAGIEREFAMTGKGLVEVDSGEDSDEFDDDFDDSEESEGD